MLYKYINIEMFFAPSSVFLGLLEGVSCQDLLSLPLWGLSFLCATSHVRGAGPFWPGVPSSHTGEWVGDDGQLPS